MSFTELAIFFCIVAAAADDDETNSLSAAASAVFVVVAVFCCRYCFCLRSLELLRWVNDLFATYDIMSKL